MTYAKLKLAIGITAGILLAGGAVTVAISQTRSDDKWTPQEIAKEAQDAYAALSSYSDVGIIVVEGSGSNEKTIFNIRLQRPNFYRIDWKSTGGIYTSAGVVWSEGKGDFLVSGPVEKVLNDQPRRMNDMQQAFASAMGVSRSAATIPATFYKQNYGDVLGVPALGRSELTKQNDEKIGGVDCYVFTSRLDATKLLAQAKLPENVGSLGITTTTFWIGKRDHLIHQTRTTTERMSVTMPHQSDDTIKTILERQNKPATPEAIAAWRTQMDATMKLAPGAKFVFTETHENIVLNKTFTQEDFSRGELIVPGQGVGQVHDGMTLDEVIKKLGEPDKRSADILEYTRFGFAVVANKKEMVRAVFCGDSSGLPNSALVNAFTARTKEGIGMGSSKAEIVKIYGETKESIGQQNLPGRESLVYSKLGLTFSLADSKVHHIIVDFRIPK